MRGRSQGGGVAPRLPPIPSLPPSAGGGPSPFLRSPQLLRVSLRALGAGVQLDEELGELALGEHGLQQALQEHVDQPAVQLLVLEHLEDAQDALAGGVRADDVLQLVCTRRERVVSRAMGYGTGGERTVGESSGQYLTLDNGSPLLVYSSPS